MSSPLQLLREGILSANLDKIREAFYQLTGERLASGEEKGENPLPKKKRGRPKKNKEKPAPPIVVEASPPPKPIESPRNTQSFIAPTKGQVKNRSGKREPLQLGPRENKFVDDFSIDPHLTQKANPTLKAMYDRALASKTPRRPPPAKISVRCAFCNKDYQVSPGLVADESLYRCDECCVGRK